MQLTPEWTVLSVPCLCAMHHFNVVQGTHINVTYYPLTPPMFHLHKPKHKPKQHSPILTCAVRIIFEELAVKLGVIQAAYQGETYVNCDSLFHSYIVDSLAHSVYPTYALVTDYWSHL